MIRMPKKKIVYCPYCGKKINEDNACFDCLFLFQQYDSQTNDYDKTIEAIAL